MRIGIYTRKTNPELPTIDWMIQNGFDAFEIYEEIVINEYSDITEREELNMLIYDAEFGHIDAVYVKSLNVVSAITLKLLQFLIQMQELNLTVYYDHGCIISSDTNIRSFQDQIVSHWKMLSDQSAKFIED